MKPSGFYVDPSKVLRATGLHSGNWNINKNGFNKPLFRFY